MLGKLFAGLLVCNQQKKHPVYDLIVSIPDLCHLTYFAKTHCCLSEFGTSQWCIPVSPTFFHFGVGKTR